MNFNAGCDERTTPESVTVDRGMPSGARAIDPGSYRAAVDEPAVNWSDSAWAPLRPGVLLPTQLPLTPGTSISGERRLMMAILKDAIACYLTNPGKRNKRAQRLFREAECWLFVRNSYWTFSFEGVCDALGLNAQCLRRGVLRLREQQQDRVPSPGARGSTPVRRPSTAAPPPLSVRVRG